MRGRHFFALIEFLLDIRTDLFNASRDRSKGGTRVVKNDQYLRGGEKRPDRASKPFVGPKGEADQGFLSSIDRGRPKPWTPITTNHVATNTCRAANA